MRIVPISELRSLPESVLSKMSMAGIVTVHQLALARNQGSLSEKVGRFCDDSDVVDMEGLEAEINALLTTEELQQIAGYDPETQQRQVSYGVINPTEQRDQESASENEAPTSEGEDDE